MVLLHMGVGADTVMISEADRRKIQNRYDDEYEDEQYDDEYDDDYDDDYDDGYDDDYATRSMKSFRDKEPKNTRTKNGRRDENSDCGDCRFW